MSWVRAPYEAGEHVRVYLLVLVVLFGCREMREGVVVPLDEGM